MKKGVQYIVIALFVLFTFGISVHSDVNALINYEAKGEKITFENAENEAIKEGKSKQIVDNLQKSYDYISVAVQFIDDFDVERNDPDYDMTMEEAQEIVRQQREKVKAHYEGKNEQHLKKLGLRFLGTDVEVSSYSNFVFLYYKSKDFYDFYLDECKNIAKNARVGQVYIRGFNENETKEELIRVKSKTRVYPYADCHPQWNGTGVSVGILDVGIINENHPEFMYTDYLIRDEWYYWETVSDHATTIALTIGGNAGIAPGARLLSAEFFLSWVSPTEWLINNGANIINISFSSGTPGQYTSTAAYMDKIARNCDLLIVGSAGNRSGGTNGDSKVTSPKTGYNVITVGNTSYWGYIDIASSYVTDFPVSKPNLSAPAPSIEFPGYTTSFGGTSYSAALVSGIASLVMQSKPRLLARPHPLGALLAASATPNYCHDDKDASGYEKMVGAGWVNLELAIKNTDFVSAFYHRQNVPGETIIFTPIGLQGGKRVKIAFYHYVNSDGSTNVQMTNYDLYLRDGYANYVAVSESLTNNSELIDIVLPANAGGFYIIEVVQIGQKYTNFEDFCSYSYVQMDPDLSTITDTPLPDD